VSRATLESFEPAIAPRKALWESIVEPMRRAIVLGALPAGLHLEEPALAQKFGVSRIPVREALVRLEHEGLVRVEPRRGAFIVGMTEEDVHDVYELRSLIESRAARRAAARVGAEWLARLGALAAQMDEALRRRDPAAMVEPDVQFHRELVAAAGSRQLLAGWERLAGLIGTILSVTDSVHYGATPDAVHGHQLIIDALARRDADLAERELAEHLAGGERVMREAMRSVRAASGGDE
jgi:GntR family transcriptional regulator, gluconate operon transcriptional repressor